MSRVCNVTSLIAQRFLSQHNTALNKSLERLSTGLAINRAADDPAGLVASENLRSDIRKIETAISNAQRADQVVNAAEGGLTEVSTLLEELQSLVSQAGSEASLSTAEKEANQIQVNSIIQTIDRIAATTSFAGAKLLNGTYDFQVSTGSLDDSVLDYNIRGAKLGTTSKDVNVIVTQSAQHAGLFLHVGGRLNLNNIATNRLVLEIAGSKGTREFSFASGTTMNAIAASVNIFTDTTGVSAATSGTGVILKSDAFGSDQFVSVDVISHGNINTQMATAGIYMLSSSNENMVRSGSGQTYFGDATSPIRDAGQDVGGVINGITATGDGTKMSINTDALDLSITLSSSSTTAAAAQTLKSFTAFSISAGGAKFNLGPNVTLDNQVRLGIQNVAARRLGEVGTGFLDDLASGGTLNVIDGDAITSQKVVDKAIDQIAAIRGRLGSFQKFAVGTTITSLGTKLENAIAAESIIRDTDFAAETAEITRRQVLAAAATHAANIANTQSQNILALLG